MREPGIVVAAASVLTVVLCAGELVAQPLTPRPALRFGPVELVGEGTVSTSEHDAFPAIDPVDGSLWFSRYESDFARQTIYRAPSRPEGWGPPTVAPFSGRWGDRAPRFSPDGGLLYFTSGRPDAAAEGAQSLGLWVVARSEDGSWGAPQPASLINGEGNDMHAAITGRSLWFASTREGGRGRADLYRLPRHGPSGAPENVGPPLSDSLSQPDVWVSEHDDWLILVVTEGESGMGGDDLYVSRWLPGAGWEVPTNLGSPINTAEYEYGPTVSPDGRYLYFSSHRRGSADIFRAPILGTRALSTSRALERVYPEGWDPTRARYSPALRADGVIHVSGITGVVRGRDLDAEGQARRVFEVLQNVLREAGSEVADVIEITTFHLDMSETLPAFMEVSEDYFPPGRVPAWTAVEVSGLYVPGARVELKATARARGGGLH